MGTVCYNRGNNVFFPLLKCVGSWFYTSLTEIESSQYGIIHKEQLGVSLTPSGPLIHQDSTSVTIAVKPKWTTLYFLSLLSKTQHLQGEKKNELQTV